MHRFAFGGSLIRVRARELALPTIRSEAMKLRSCFNSGPGRQLVRILESESWRRSCLPPSYFQSLRHIASMSGSQGFLSGAGFGTLERTLGRGQRPSRVFGCLAANCLCVLPPAAQPSRTERLVKWVEKKMLRIGASQIVEDGVQRERKAEKRSTNTIMVSQRVYATLVDRKVLTTHIATARRAIA